MTDHDPTTEPTHGPPTTDRTPTEVVGRSAAPELVEDRTQTVRAAAASRRWSATRWGVALVVVALVIGAVAVGANALTARADPAAFAYVPADSLVVAEFRPELPGDQREKFGTLLSKFPGFDDQANLEDKIDEALDRLFAEASDGEVSYRDDVKPYLGGPLVVAVPAAPASGSEPMDHGVVIATTDVACATAFEDKTTSTQSHDGVELTIASEADATLACARDGQHLVLGDLDSVKRALDTKRSGNDITTSDGWASAQGAFDGDHVAFAYVDLRAAIESELGVEAVGMADLPIDQVPEWLALRLVLEGDALVVDFASPNVTTADGAPEPSRSAPPAKVSTLAPRLPASTIAVFEGHGIGIGILNALDTARADPETAAQLEELEQAVMLLGGLDELVGWIGDTAVVVTRDGSEIGGGLVVEATDAAEAERVLDQLKGFLLLAGGSGGITVDDVQHGDATITVVDLGDLGGVPGMGLPLDGNAEEVVIAYTVHDGYVVFGVGQEFVEAVLDTGAGSALADQASYRRTIELAGATNDMQAFVDVAAFAELTAAELEGEEAARYESDIKPYVDPFAGAGMAVGRDGDLVVGRMVLVTD